MVRERKCILCHIVYNSKKEMEEHMRSMLHHRELENLKGRYENNFASFFSVQFACHSLEELMSYFPYKLNCTVYFYASLSCMPRDKAGDKHVLLMSKTQEANSDVEESSPVFLGQQ